MGVSSDQPGSGLQLQAQSDRGSPRNGGKIQFPSSRSTTQHFSGSTGRGLHSNEPTPAIVCGSPGDNDRNTQLLEKPSDPGIRRCPSSHSTAGKETPFHTDSCIWLPPFPCIRALLLLPRPPRCRLSLTAGQTLPHTPSLRRRSGQFLQHEFGLRCPSLSALLPQLDFAHQRDGRSILNTKERG